MNNDVTVRILRRGLKSTCIGVLIIITSCFGMSVYAHHSTAAYDQNVTLAKEGVIKKLSIRNPHSVFFLEIEEGNGEVALWSIEGSNAAAYIAAKNEGLLAEGVTVSIEFHPVRDGRKSGELINMTLSNGQTLGSHSQIPGKNK